MWERLSYYGMRALLVGSTWRSTLLLPGHVEHVLFYPQIFAFFTALMGEAQDAANSSPHWSVAVIPSWSMPRRSWAAGRPTICWASTGSPTLIGMLLMAFGHFMMAAESLLFPALLLLVFGGGIFKPNTTSQVGLLYKTGDPRRDSGYAIFYIGINLGAFIAPFVCGTLGEDVGWEYGFAAAGVGILFRGWLSILPAGVICCSPTPLPALRQRSRAEKPSTAPNGKSVGALLALLIPLSLYWACNEQQGNTIALWSIDN